MGVHKPNSATVGERVTELSAKTNELVPGPHLTTPNRPNF